MQKDLDVGEWWAGVKARARDMRTRQMGNGVGAPKQRGGFRPHAHAYKQAPAFVAANSHSHGHNKRR